MPKPKTKMVKLCNITADPQLNMRDGGMDDEIVEEYTAVVRAEKRFRTDPVVFHDLKTNQFWLADGFKRLAAYQRAGHEAMPCEVREGNRSAAEDYAFGSNDDHGQRRTKADKRVAVARACLRYADKSDRFIAGKCAVSPTFVGIMRKEAAGVHVDTPKAGSKSQPKVGKSEPAPAEKSGGAASPAGGLFSDQDSNDYSAAGEAPAQTSQCADSPGGEEASGADAATGAPAIAPASPGTASGSQPTSAPVPAPEDPLAAARRLVAGGSVLAGPAPAAKPPADLESLESLLGGIDPVKFDLLDLDADQFKMLFPKQPVQELITFESPHECRMVAARICRWVKIIREAVSGIMASPYADECRRAMSNDQDKRWHESDEMIVQGEWGRMKYGIRKYSCTPLDDLDAFAGALKLSMDHAGEKMVKRITDDTPAWVLGKAVGQAPEVPI